MNLFSKDNGALAILNVILVLWILTAISICVSDITNLLIKDYEYSYEDYKISYCDFEYETEEECNKNYNIFKVDQKVFEIEYKRSIIISIINVVLVSGTLVILNVGQRKRKK